MPSAVGYQPTLATEMGDLQERITSTKTGSITSVQAVYVPADDLTDPAPATTFTHLDATTVLSRSISRSACSRLSTRSRLPPTLSIPRSSARSTTVLPSRSRSSCRSTPTFRTSSPFWVWTSCPRSSALRSTVLVRSSSYLSQSFHVAEKFTGNPGVYVRVEDTVRSFAEIVDGKADDLPEQAFRYASTIEDVRERARKMEEK
mgnify:CR=1 FL=1